MIILRNNSHGENARVCVGIFATALRNKKNSQILNKNPSPFFHIALLVLWSPTLLQRGHISELFLGVLFLGGVVNLEIDNSLNWLLFNIVAARQQAMQTGSKVRYF